MKKVRLADVGRVAGVSAATVDRVLNGRPGVRPETAQRVALAMARLGYSQSALQARLAATPMSLLLILPASQGQFMAAVREALEREIAGRVNAGLTFRMVELPKLETGLLVAALDAVPDGTGAVVVLAQDVPEVAAAINRLEDRGIRTVTLMADATGSRRRAFVGAENYAAGRTAAALMARFLPGPATVGLLMGDPQVRLHLDRRSGFEQVIAGHPRLRLVAAGVGGSDMARFGQLSRAFLAEHPGPVGLYMAGGGLRAVLESLATARRSDVTVIAHELTPDSRDALVSGRIAAVVGHDVELLAAQAVEAAIFDHLPPQRPHPIRIWLRENLPPE